MADSTRHGRRLSGMRIIRRSGIFLLIIVLLSISIAGGLSASASQSIPPHSGVDLVILLDNSNSMSTMGAKSDIPGYRFDATAIMLNMISLYSSRVTVIPFHNEIGAMFGNYPIDRLINVAMLNSKGSPDIEGAQNRSGLTNAVINRAPKESGGTLIGTALQQAVKVLNDGRAERAINGNQAMILLLADGKIATLANIRNPGRIIDAEEGLITAALNSCRSQGYTLYSVILQNASNTEIDTESISKMRRWALDTGGTAHELSDPADLPEVFSQMFGHQIGSSMVSYQLTAQPDGMGGFFIEIDIPNKSVEEANILLQSDGLTNMKLFKPDGVEAIADNRNVFNPQVGGRFTQYKIFRPLENGEWKLTFNSDTKAPENISVNVLYNYTEILEARVEPTEKLYQKGQDITITAELFKGGRPSTDQLLYKPILNAEDENNGIRAWAYLMHETYSDTPFIPNEALSVIELPASQRLDSFEKTLTLKDFKDGNGNPFVKSGKYALHIHVEGSGLVRDFPNIPYEVENQHPMATTNSITPLTIEIDDPRTTEYGKPQTEEIDFSRYVNDADGDELKPDVQIDDSSIVAIGAIDKKLKTTLTTQGKSGETKLRFQAEDNERDKLVDVSGNSLANGFEIDVKVISVIDELRGAYTPRFTILSDKNEFGYYPKNSTVEFRLNIEGRHSDYQIADFNPVMKVFHINADEKNGKDLELDLSKENMTTWTGSLDLDDRENHELRTELILVLNTPGKETLLINQTSNSDIKTGNQPPVVMDDMVKALPSTAEVEPFTLLKQVASEPWTVVLDDLFSDANFPFDTLTFTVDGEKDVVSYGDVVKTKDIASDKYPSGRDVYMVTFTPKNPGKASFVLTAIDGSEEKAQADYTIEVVSMTAVLKEKTIRYGTIALAALIFLAIVLRIIKPSFRGMKLTRKRDGNLHGETTLPNTKATLSLSQYADETMLRDVGLGKMNLRHIRLKAGRSYILVMMRKGNHNNAIIKVGNETLSFKHRKAKLNVGREIQVSLNDHTISWLLQMNPKSQVPKAPVRRGPNA